MKISSHTIIVPDYPQEGEHLVYHTRTQALVKIDQELRDTLEKIETLYEKSPEVQKFQKELTHFYKMGIIVKDDADDNERLKRYLHQLKYGVNSEVFVANILTTYACNFKCTYCFEESSRTAENLEFSTQKEVIVWLKKRVERLGYGGLYINYYGGEPLLNPEAIEYISKEMKQWCKEKEMRFNIGLQTNGYLLTPELVDKYISLGLNNVRISLDGIKEDNDRYRVLRGGQGTFDKIMKNIMSCIDKIKIGISVSYDKGDVSVIEKLLDYFDEMGILHKLGKFIFTPLHPTLGPRERPELIQNSQCMCNTDDDVMVRAVTKINQLLESKGLPTGKGMANSICPVTRQNGGVTIDQHGRLFKCNSMLGHPELSVGDVRNDEYNEQGNEFRDLDVWRQCPQDCTYLPMCSGGCRLMSFLGSKNFKVPGCKKPYLNKVAADLIKRDYETMMAKQQEDKKRTLASTA